MVSCSDLGLAIAPAATVALTTVREASSDSALLVVMPAGDGGGDGEQKPKTLRQLRKSVAKMRSAAGSAGSAGQLSEGGAERDARGAL